MKALYALVGMKHRGTEALVSSLPAGEPLTLVREKMNKFDPNAVMVWARNEHIGYVKATQVRPLARRIEAAGKNWTRPVAVLDGPLSDQPMPPTFVEVYQAIPAVLRVTADRWPMVEVEE